MKAQGLKDVVYYSSRDDYLVLASIERPHDVEHRGKYHAYRDAVRHIGQEEDRLQRLLQELYRTFELDAKIVQRKKYHIVYLKEGAQIVDALNIMGAYVALMNLENVRIFKEMRGSVNRIVNCETANINKVVGAACRQVEDIRYIQSKIGLDELPPALREMALIRLEYPDSSLKELGELCDPPVGKSGVNHRLRKLGEIAKKLGRSNA